MHLQWRPEVCLKALIIYSHVMIPSQRPVQTWRNLITSNQYTYQIPKWKQRLSPASKASNYINWLPIEPNEKVPTCLNCCTNDNIKTFCCKYDILLPDRLQNKDAISNAISCFVWFKGLEVSTSEHIVMMFSPYRIYKLRYSI